MIISFRMIHLSCLYLQLVKSYESAKVRHDAPESNILDDFYVLPFRTIVNPVRAVHAFPPTTGSLDAAAESRQLGRILALLGGPREARGRLTAPGALRRRPPSAAAALRAAPRFVRRSLASLGWAELRKC